MLRTIRERGPSHVYLGLNAGHLGFLLNDVGDAEAVAAALERSAWNISSFPRLRLTAWRADGTELSALAVNDLYLERATGQTAHLEVHIDGNVVVDRLICDGLLASTSLGSTAYSYSAGGVPCHPQVPALLVTPIAPHVPRLTPMILPLDAIVELSALDTHRRPVRAVADGVALGEVVRMRVEDSHDNVRLAFLEGHNFTRTLVRKVLRA
jgi:NAD+ kinase